MYQNRAPKPRDNDQWRVRLETKSFGPLHRSSPDFWTGSKFSFWRSEGRFRCRLLVAQQPWEMQPEPSFQGHCAAGAEEVFRTGVPG